ncbi:hypothetical protein ABFX02_08G208400 [Erythranthe guttata]
MAVKYLSLSLLIIFAMHSILITFEEASATSIAADWKKIENLEDPVVVKIAEFAVEEHNNKYSDHVELEFVKIIKGEILKYFEINYKLVISAKSDIHPGESAVNNYEAFVAYEELGVAPSRLVYFKEITQG